MEEELELYKKNLYNNVTEKFDSYKKKLEEAAQQYIVEYIDDKFKQRMDNYNDIIRNLLERLKEVNEIELINDEQEIVMSYASLFDYLHIKVEDNILKKV